MLNGGRWSGEYIGLAGGNYPEDLSGADVIVDDATGIRNGVYGAYGTQSGLISNNRVTIDTTLDVSVYGASGSTGSSDVINNTVTINGTTSGGVYGGGSSAGTVSGNSVTINGTASGEVSGGYEAGNGNSFVTDNTVTVNGTVSGPVSGGRGGGQVSGNSVILDDGAMVTGKVYGGLNDGSHGTLNSNGNNVFILSGATVKNEVCGGSLDGRSAGEVSGNAMTVSGGADITDATLYGGFIGTGATGTMDDNTLNLTGFTGTTRNIVGFNTVNINNANLKTGQPVLTLTDASTDLSATTVRLQHSGFLGGTLHAAGEKFALISGTSLTGGSAGTATALQGVSLLYDLDTAVSVDGKSFDATVKGVKGLVRETVTFSTSRLATVEFLNQGVDFALGAGLDKAMASVKAGQGAGVFGGVSGSETRNDTGGGSHARASGTHFIVGAAGKVNQDKANDMIAGAYVEAGWGDITDSNAIRDAHGDTHYYGVGLIGKFVRRKGAAKGLYAQANLQVGHVKTDYDSNLYDLAGNRGSYDKGSTYWGAGLGLGYQFDVSNRFNLDVYGQYKWLHLDSMDTSIAGDPYAFDAINSHRTKLGGRLNYTANRQFTPYVGLAWEHEFSGKSNGNVYGYSLEEVSMKGSSGVGEIGVSFKPDETGAWSVDANVQGYFGQREGVTGRVLVNYAF